jgi:hypothetical protein
MSSKEGSVFVVYHRARVRWLVTSSGACPCSAYQRGTTLKQISQNGTVHGTTCPIAGLPTPMIWRASAKACSIPHRDAYGPPDLSEDPDRW